MAGTCASRDEIVADVISASRASLAMFGAWGLGQRQVLQSKIAIAVNPVLQEYQNRSRTTNYRHHLHLIT